MWDVIVVGAGPAGTTVSSLLAEKGHHVLLLDKAVFPREKPCGEYVSPGCLNILERLRALKPIEEAAQKVWGMRITSYDGTTFQAEYSSPDASKVHGLALSRQTLDDLLLQHAKTSPLGCVEGFRAEGLLIEKGKVSGVKGFHSKSQEVFRARLVIGADGRGSMVARHLGLFRWHPSHRKMALVAHYQGVEAEQGYGEVSVGPPGYGILNPLGEGLANVSVVVGQERFPSTKGRLEGYFEERLRALPRLHRMIHPARRTGGIRVVGPLAHSARRASWNGVLLVGDAAGFYDPFTGEGVYMALRSAELAAEVADRALRADDCSAAFLKRYDTTRAQEFRGRLRLDALLQWVIAKPFFADLLARRLRTKKGVANTLMGVAGDLLPPKTALAFSLLMKLLL